MTPKPPAQEVVALIEELGFTSPSDFDLVKVAEHLNIEIRYEHLDGSAANIIGVGDHAIVSIDRMATPGRKRFSTAHEIGHWIYDKGKGLYLCKTQDLNIPWNTRAKKVDPLEKRANRFAAELLMPTEWFRTEARNREPSFNTVEDLKDVFKTSRTSTAIRLVEFGSHLAMLVMFDDVGRRKWYCASKELPDRFYPTQLLPHESNCWVDISRNGYPVSEIREVDGDMWIDHPRAFELLVTEQAIQVGRNILVLIGFRNDDAVSKIVESDEFLE